MIFWKGVASLLWQRMMIKNWDGNSSLFLLWQQFNTWSQQQTHFWNVILAFAKMKKKSSFEKMVLSLIFIIVFKCYLFFVSGKKLKCFAQDLHTYAY